MGCLNSTHKISICGKEGKEAGLGRERSGVEILVQLQPWANTLEALRLEPLELSQIKRMGCVHFSPF